MFIALMVCTSLYAYDFEKKGVYYNIKGEEAVVTSTNQVVFNFDNINEISQPVKVVIPEFVKYNKKKYLVTGIEDKSFCLFVRKMTSISIPKSVKFIGKRAFARCNDLKKIYCQAIESPMVEPDAFDELKVSDITLYVPADAVDKYKNHPVWGKFKVCAGK